MNVSEKLKALAVKRSLGSLPMSEWGPVCARCGAEEFRIDGYCSIECRDRYEYDEELALPQIVAVVEAAETRFDGTSYETATPTAFGKSALYDALAALDEQLTGSSPTEPGAPTAP